MNKKIDLYGWMLIALLSLVAGFLIGISTLMIKKNHTKDIIIREKHNEYNLNKESVLYFIDYLDIKHKDIVLKQILLETGNFTSQVCLENNNLLGLYDGRDYYKFNHWIESLVFFKYRIQNRMRPNENYYKFLHRIKYAKDPDYITKLKKF